MLLQETVLSNEMHTILAYYARQMRMIRRLGYGKGDIFSKIVELEYKMHDLLVEAIGYATVKATERLALTEQTLEPHKSVWLTMLKEGSFPTEWVATGFQSDDLVRLVREWDGRKCSLTTIGHFLTEELEVQKTRKNNLRLYKIDTIERERERWNSRLPELRQEWQSAV